MIASRFVKQLNLSVGMTVRVMTSKVEVYIQANQFSQVICTIQQHVCLSVLEVLRTFGSSSKSSSSSSSGAGKQQLLWIRVAAGWIIATDGGEEELIAIVKEPGVLEAMLQDEQSKRERMSSAVAAMLIKSYSLPRAKRLARSILKHAKEHYPQTPLLKVTNASIEDIMIILNGKIALTKAQVFEYIKAAAARQSNPLQSVIDISQEIYNIIFSRPSIWVVEDMNVITTEDVRIRNNNFIMSAAEGDCEKFQSYLQQGQELTCLHSQFLFTALHAAANFGQAEIVKIIIATGLSLNIRDPKYGQTALHYAADSGRVECAKLLLEAGADRTIPNYKGVLPYQVADEQGNIECRETLKFLPPTVQGIEFPIDGIGRHSVSLLWKSPPINRNHTPMIVEYCVEFQIVDIMDDLTDPPLLYTSVTHCQFTGLTPARQHRARIKCRAASGWSSFSSWYYVKTIAYHPEPPLPVEVLKVSINALLLHWFPPIRDNGYPVDYYELEIADSVGIDNGTIHIETGIEECLSYSESQSQSQSPSRNRSRAVSMDDENERERDRDYLDQKQGGGVGGGGGGSGTVMTIRNRRKQQKELQLQQQMGMTPISSSGEQQQVSAISKLHRIMKHKNVEVRQKYVTGLEPHRPYRIRVRAHNECGMSPWSEWSKPVAPRLGVVVEEFILSESAAKIEWFAPQLAEHRQLVAYEVQLCRLKGPMTVDLNTSAHQSTKTILKRTSPPQQQQNYEEYVTITDALTDNHFTLTGLRAGGRYQLRVRSKLCGGTGPGGLPLPTTTDDSVIVGITPTIPNGEESDNNANKTESVVGRWMSWEDCVKSETFVMPATPPDPPVRLLPRVITSKVKRNGEQEETEDLIQMAIEREHKATEGEGEAEGEGEGEGGGKDKDEDSDDDGLHHNHQHHPHHRHHHGKPPRPETTTTAVGHASNNTKHMSSNNSLSPSTVDIDSQQSIACSTTSSYHVPDDRVTLSDDLEITHDSITLVWRSGDSNGEEVVEYDIEMAKVRSYNPKDVIFARDAYMGVGGGEGGNEGDDDKTNRKKKNKKQQQKKKTGSTAEATPEDDNDNDEEDVDGFISDDDEDNFNFKSQKLYVSASDVLSSTGRGIGKERLHWERITSLGQFLGPRCFRIQGLSPGQCYTFRMKQRNACGWSKFSKASPLICTHPSVPPNAPLVLAIRNTHCVLCWEEVEMKDASLTTLEYQVQIRRLFTNPHRQDPNASPSRPGTIGSTGAVRLNNLNNQRDMQETTSSSSSDHGGIQSRSIDLNDEALFQDNWQLGDAQSLGLLELSEYMKFSPYSQDFLAASLKNSSLGDNHVVGKYAGCVVRNLVELQWYIARVRVRTVIGWSPWSVPAECFRTLR